ncbi:Sulfatase, partial [Popillia japonica]
SNTTEGKYVKQQGYATTLITDYAIDFLDNRHKEQPFCLLVHHKAPHRNWMPEPQYLNLYEDVEFPLPDTFYDDYSTRTSSAHTQESFPCLIHSTTITVPELLRRTLKRCLSKKTPELLRRTLKRCLSKKT